MSDASYLSRRAFLKVLGLGTASVTAAAALTACGGSAASSTTAAPASGSAAASAASLEPVELINVSYDPTRELYAQYNEVFPNTGWTRPASRSPSPSPTAAPANRRWKWPTVWKLMWSRWRWKAMWTL